jgi:hypothetical protein
MANWKNEQTVLFAFVVIAVVVVAIFPKIF